MKRFVEYTKQRDEGMIGNIWGAAKGAWHGLKQGWGDSQNADRNTQYLQQGAPAGFVDMRNVNSSLRSIYQAVETMQDPQTKKEVSGLLTKFQDELKKIFYRHSDEFLNKPS